jgi:hypothetical protein
VVTGSSQLDPSTAGQVFAGLSLSISLSLSLACLLACLLACSFARARALSLSHFLSFSRALLLLTFALGADGDIICFSPFFLRFFILAADNDTLAALIGASAEADAVLMMTVSLVY